MVYIVNLDGLILSLCLSNINFICFKSLKEWYDAKIRWNEADYGGLTALNLPIEKIWKPDVILYNTLVNGKVQYLDVFLSHIRQ